MNGDPTIKEISGFLVTGITVRTLNTEEANAATAKLPGLWQRFYSKALAAEIPYSLPDSRIYGVYHKYESDYKGPYSVTAGVAVSQAAESAEFESVLVRSGRYLVFEEKGIIPDIVVRAWSKVWKYFEQSSNFERRYTTDFEVYAADDEVAIHIAA